MPLPQKNSGNKKSKRETGTSIKNRKLVADLIYDITLQNDISDIHVGRVIRKLGNGRVEIFYVAKEKLLDKEGVETGKYNYVSYEKQATIKGSLRGRGKRSVWIDIGTAVIIADTGLNTLSIIAVLTSKNLIDISSILYVDSRILSGSGESEDAKDCIQFDEESGDDLSDREIDNI